MKTIDLVDSIVIQTSSGPKTISKLHPLYSRILDATDENQLNAILAITYDTIYEAYDQAGHLICKIVDKSGISVKYPASSNSQPVPSLDDTATLLGRFITKEELIESYPEYFI